MAKVEYFIKISTCVDYIKVGNPNGVEYFMKISTCVDLYGCWG